MKKIALVLIALLQFAVASAQNNWGAWTQNHCFKGIQYRCKVKDYNSSAKQYTWDVEIKNSYSIKVSLTFDIKNSSIDGRTTIPPGGTDKSWTLNASNAALYIDISKVCFHHPNGFDQCSDSNQKGYASFAQCDTGQPNYQVYNGVNATSSGTANSGTTTAGKAQQNNLDEYTKSKAEMEAKLNAKNAEIQRQNQESANKQQQFLSNYNAAVIDFNKGNWADAAAKFKLAIPYATTPEQRSNAQSNYDKAARNISNTQVVTQVGNVLTDLAKSIDAAAEEKRKQREIIRQQELQKQEAQKQNILENKEYYLDVVSMENRQLGEYADYFVAKAEKSGYSYITTHGPYASSDKATWGSKNCYLLFSKAQDTITFSATISFSTYSGLTRRYWVSGKNLALEIVTNFYTKMFEISDIKNFKNQSKGSYTGVYFESDLNPNTVKAALSAIDFSASNYKGYEIEFANSNRLKTENTVQAYLYNGAIFHNGQGDLKRDKEQSIYWYTKAAELGSLPAMITLGYKLLPEGSDKDYSRSLSWFRKAAELDYPGAYEALADMCKNGRGVPKDYEEAKNWYIKAADKGSPSAMQNLGLMYEYGGEKFKKSKSEAEKWYKLACATNPIYCNYSC